MVDYADPTTHFHIRFSFAFLLQDDKKSQQEDIEVSFDDFCKIVAEFQVEGSQAGERGKLWDNISLKTNKVR